MGRDDAPRDRGGAGDVDRRTGNRAGADGRTDRTRRTEGDREGHTLRPEGRTEGCREDGSTRGARRHPSVRSLTMNAGELIETFTSMASTVTLRVVGPTPGAREALAEARRIVEDVAAACTRFDPTSPLMRANADPTSWHIVPRVCADAIAAAHEAHVTTEGRFDPRILTQLQRDGYAAARSFSESPIVGSEQEHTAQAARAPWEPSFEGRSVRIGDEPIDLGGIGKGLAVRWAAEALAGAGDGILVDAGGDLVARGASPDGGPWLIGVENPWDASGDPLVVLDATDAAVATSSIRLRSWEHAGRVRHHLIDPRTGEPGGAGLVSVTVIGADPADAEVWSKTLFLEGASGIERAALDRRLSAVWVDMHGGIGMTPGAEARVIWKVSHADH